MEFEYWWLLALPLFFVLGWWARGRERRDAAQARQVTRLPTGYLRGVNLLLDDQPDAAIDAFTEVVRVQPEALELHFALGALFRRRGETDRSIRVHRNLVERSQLSEADRNRARFALGEDYLKAGLIDRAEAAFDALIDTPLESAAARQRLEIARMTRDWERVVELAEALPIGDPHKPLIQLHAHAELAEVALDEARLEQAAAQIAAARAAVPDHPRVLIDLALLQALQGHREAALATHLRLSAHHPQALPLHAAGWIAVAQTGGDAAVVGQVIERIEAVPDAMTSPDVLRPLALARAEIESVAAAIDWLRARLLDHPSLLGMQTLLELMDRADMDRADMDGADMDRTDSERAAASAGATWASHGSARVAAPMATAGATVVSVVDADAELAAARDARDTLASLIKRQAERQSRFVCCVCGFRGRRHYWQCPGCARWDTYPALREDDDDAHGRARVAP